MVDFSLTDEQLTLQRSVRDLATREIAPITEQVERMDHASSAPWDLVRPVFQKASRLGITHLLIPQEYGGGGGSCLDNALVQEEIGAVDVGIAAAYFNLAATAPRVIVAGGTEAQKREWLGEICASEDFLVASAGSEADQAGSDTFCPYPDPRVGLRTTSRRDGDDYVLNGTKAAFITSAGIASAYFVMARNDLDKPGFMSTSFFYVPADTPGLSVGPRTQLIGWKTAHNAEVVLDNVRVPKNRLLGEQEFLAPNVFGAAYPYIAVGFAACHVGLARAATEYATKYARERISWLQPIINHQAVARLLADALVETQVARLAVWDAACAADAGSASALMKVPIAKTYATDTAIKAAEAAVKVLGSNGITREYQTARYLNDAWIGWACDGANDMLRLNMIAMQEMQHGMAPVGGPFQVAGAP